MQTNNKMNIDFDTAWSSLKPALDKEQARREKKKRRFIVFWFTLLAIGLGGSAIFMNNNAKINDKAVVKNEIIVQKNDDKAQSEENVAQSQHNITHKQENLTQSKNNITQSKNDITHKQDNITQSRNNLTQSKNNFTHKQDNITQSKKNFTQSRKNIPRRSNNLTQFKKNKAQSNANIIQSGLTLAQTLQDATQSKKNIPQLNNDLSISQSTITELKQNLTDKTNNDAASNKQIENNTSNQQIKSITNNTKSQTPNNNSSKSNKQQKPNLSYGLQFNMPVVKAYNVLDANADKNIYAALIPTAWVSKTLSSKNSLMLFVNPYSNYYASNKAIANSTNYNIVTQQATQALPQQAVYTQTIAVNKLIGVEAGIMLQHQLTSKLSIGAGVSSFFAQSALLQNKVVKSDKTVSKDNIYSVGKNDNEWNYIQPNFFLAKVECSYSFNKFNAGCSFSKPISNIFNNIETSKTPINTNLFIRWKMK